MHSSPIQRASKWDVVLIALATLLLVGACSEPNTSDAVTAASAPPLSESTSSVVEQTTATTITTTTTTTAVPERTGAFIRAYRAAFPSGGASPDEIAVLGEEICVLLATSSAEELLSYFSNRSEALGREAAENIRGLAYLASETMCPWHANMLENLAAIEAQALFEDQTDYAFGANVGFDSGYADGLAGAWAYQAPEYDESAAWVAGFLDGYTQGFEQGAGDLPAASGQESDRWCLEYKLALEVAGLEKAKATMSSIPSPYYATTYHSSMNRGMYRRWVADHLARLVAPYPDPQAQTPSCTLPTTRGRGGTHENGGNWWGTHCFDELDPGGLWRLRRRSQHIDRGDDD